MLFCFGAPAVNLTSKLCQDFLGRRYGNRTQTQARFGKCPGRARHTGESAGYYPEELARRVRVMCAWVARPLQVFDSL